jgi:hypothetical protein
VRFDAAQRVADAVLYEGYVLYPYRASAAKNQFRWQFGVLAPRAPADDGEPWYSQTECLIDSAASDARLFVRVRFLRPEPTATGWLEGVPVEIDLAPIDLAAPLTRAFALDTLGAGVHARATVDVIPVDAYIKVGLRLENLETWGDRFHDRDEMLRRSLAGTHALLAVERGRFVSLVEPPERAASVVAACHNRNTWPVLVGDRTERRLLLSSPIVLYDYPAVAPESPGDLCDAAEIDEILSLRILTMTDEEKREARATDPRARAILDRVEALTPDALGALHGTLRTADFFNPAGTAPPGEAFVMVAGCRVSKGSCVRLRPSRRADAMDMFLKDQRATVSGVYRDVDDRVYVAVTVDADPAASLHESFGRFFYFDPTEIEPVECV